jgi:dihydrodipicolinate synthase/N-acetylneuraminate lyase
MATPNWLGVYPALLTPFNSDESIDEKMFLKNLQAQIDAGVHGVIIGGSLGEASTILNQEKIMLLKRAKLIAPMNFPIILNIAESTTKAAVAFVKEAEAAGCRWVYVVAPYAL